ncbi:MAG: FAD-dependent monooxygenase [Methylophilaceae bacterium]|jgi:2-polyprenylphenol 6-hydroxylase
MMQESSDVVILGAGIVGMATLIAIDKYDIEVTLISDAKTIHKKEADPRFYTITPGVKTWLEKNGVWTFLPKKEVSSVRSIIVYSDKEHSSLKFDADDAGMNELAFIVNHDDLEKAFIHRISEISYEKIKTNKIKSLSVGVKDINLSFANDNIRQFKLAIGADGSNSWVRSQSSIHFKSKDFDQTAIVFNIKTSKAHQGCAYQKFMYHGILAFLPFHTHEFSIVFSVNNEILEEYKNLTDAKFIQMLEKETSEMFGEIVLTTNRQHFPLNMKINESLISDRVLLVGEAAHQVHPLAGQGLNLGLRDVIEFDELLSSNKKYHHDLGLNSFLKKYNRNRKTDILSLSYLTDKLSSLFTSKNHIVDFVINSGLNKINQNQLVKKILIKKAIH